MQVFMDGRRVDGSESGDFDMLDRAGEWLARLQAHEVVWGYRGRLIGGPGDVVVTTVWGATDKALILRHDRAGAYRLAILRGTEDITVAWVPEHLVGPQPRTDGRVRI